MPEPYINLRVQYSFRAHGLNNHKFLHSPGNPQVGTQAKHGLSQPRCQATLLPYVMGLLFVIQV